MHVALVERLEPSRGRASGSISAAAPVTSRFTPARAGAVVTASDLSPALVETAQRRAAELGLDLTLEVADCQDLPYDDASFDVVSSSVGVIFAPDHERVAHELARVCRPGGRVGLTAWRKSSGVGQMFDAMPPYMPTPPPGVGSPFQWGDEAYVASMLGDAFDAHLRGARLAPRRETTPARCGSVFRDNYGPSFTLWSSLDDEQRATLDRRHDGVLRGDRTGDGISVERRYIVVTGVRKG